MRKLPSIILITFAFACTAKKDASQTDTTASSTTTTTTTGTAAPIASTETAVAPEVNPPGDIPDTQAFVIFQNTTGGYQLQSQGRAVTITCVSEANLPGGKAVVIKYMSNSEPNPVTNKRVRLENVAYIFHRSGKEATLAVWAPQGADNVDQWNRMANSFRWL